MHLASPTAIAELFSDTVYVTEKTDGFAFEVGFDEEGFYSRTANSPKMRRGGDYTAVALQKFGRDVDYTISNRFAVAHKAIAKYMWPFGEYLWDVWSLKGEWIHTTNEPGHLITPASTSYHRMYFGAMGGFIVHSQTSSFCPIGWEVTDDDLFTVDHDYVATIISTKHQDIGQKVFPKWGKETEGVVWHGTNGQCMKTFDPSFEQRRRAKWSRK
jgi:hypothetical protein